MATKKWSAFPAALASAIIASDYIVGLVAAAAGTNAKITFAQLAIALNKSGQGEVFRGSGSPEGVVTCNSGAGFYYDFDALSPTYQQSWVFGGTAGTNTGWYN